MVGSRDSLELVRLALELSRSALEGSGEEATLEIRDERSTDISTRGDRAVSRALIDFFRGRGFPAVVLSEESGRIDLCPEPEYLVAFDDIDGTDNFFRGRGLLPYCTVVSIFAGAHPKYGDSLAAGIVEHRSGRTWLAERGGGATVSMPGRAEVPAASSRRAALDRRSSVVVDLYSARERAEELGRLAGSAWLKDFGSSALHLAGVASGMFDGYANLRQKAHELGAGYLLVKEAGGILLDAEGRSLDGLAYDFDAVLGIVAAGTREMAALMLDSLRARAPGP
jgi:myo-inositol-1(or 4)-monophosphatase